VAKGVFSAVNQALAAAQMDRGTAKEIASYMETMVHTVIGIAIHQTIGGSRKAIVKRLIHEVLRDQAQTLLDGPGLLSYTSVTRDSLEAALALMQGWSQADRGRFLADRAAFNEIDRKMGEAVLVTNNSITAFSTEIADALGGFGGDVVEAIGDFGGPVGKGLAVATKTLEYTANATSFGIPFLTLYGVLGGPNVDVPATLFAFVYPQPGTVVEMGLVERGVAAAFGRTDLDGVAPPGRAAPREAASGGPNPNLAARLSTAANGAGTALDPVILALEEDRLDDALSAYATAAGSFLSASQEVDRAASAVAATVLQGLLTVEGASAFVADAAELQGYALGLHRMAADLLFRALLEIYAGPTDVYYLAERNRLVAALETYRRRADALAEAAEALGADGSGALAQPAVVVEEVSLASEETGGPDVTASPESFTVTARVRNTGSTPVAGVSLRLDPGDAPSLTVDTPAEVTVGALSADDGEDGAGPDEAEVTWRVTYTADLDEPQGVLLTVRVLEAGGVPDSFVTLPGAAVLEPGRSLLDADLDGMPDGWESDHGLDPAADDSDEDPDGDGLADGLEVSGTATDPLSPDTDGDGVGDATDGRPLDAGTANPAGSPIQEGEPAVSVSAGVVELTEDAPVATLEVTNGGEGVLRWTAASSNDALVVVSPAAPDVRSGTGFLLLSVADGFDGSAGTAAEGRVVIADVAGAVHDVQTVTVRVGRGAVAQPPPDGTGGTGGGGVPAGSGGPSGSSEADGTDGGRGDSTGDPGAGPAAGGGGGGGCLIQVLSRDPWY